MAAGRRSVGRSAGAVVVLALVLGLTGCLPPRTPLWTSSGSGDVFDSGFVTRDGDDGIRVESTDLALRTQALPTNTGGNTRMLIWPRSADAVTDAESCATWSRRTGTMVQQGAALRISRNGSRIRAVTVTQNIFYRAGWLFNVHTWDTNRAIPFQHVGTVDLGSTFFADHQRPPPWTLCARVIGARVEMKIWDPGQREPAWGDPAHGGAVTLPRGWQAPGQVGWYIGHLRAGDRADFSATSTATYDVVPEPPPIDGWVNDPNGPGRRVALMTDSLVTRHQQEWRSGPLASDGPLALWAEGGAPFNASGSWVRTLTPFPEVAVLAQGVNSAWPLFGSDGWQASDRAALDEAAHQALAAPRRKGDFPGVRCVVLVTVGYPGNALPLVAENDDRANADIRAKAASGPEYRLADWKAASAGRPWFEADGLHLNAAGSAAYQQVITDGVRSCPSSG